MARAAQRAAPARYPRAAIDRHRRHRAVRRRLRPADPRPSRRPARSTSAPSNRTLSMLSGLDRYQGVAWEIIGPPGDESLLVRAREKPYAPPFMMLGVNLENLTSNDFRAQLAARYLAFDLLGSGIGDAYRRRDRLRSVVSILAVSPAHPDPALRPAVRRDREKHHPLHPGRRGGGGVHPAAAAGRCGPRCQSLTRVGADGWLPLRTPRR